MCWSVERSQSRHGRPARKDGTLIENLFGYTGINSLFKGKYEGLL